jgi:hypothetical protein
MLVNSTAKITIPITAHVCMFPARGMQRGGPDLTFAHPFPIISINAAHLSSPANAYGHANPRRSAVHARSLKRSPLVHTA